MPPAGRAVTAGYATSRPRRYRRLWPALGELHGIVDEMVHISDRSPVLPHDLLDLVDEAVALAERWMAATERDQTRAERAASARLAALLRDPRGLDLAVRFVDRVARPEDVHVAARELAQISAGDAAGFLSPVDRLLLTAGSRLARLAPRLVVPVARHRLRQLVGHLVVDARDPHLARHLARLRHEGFRVNVNLLGEAVLGEDEAARRTERTRALLERDDVDYASIKVTALVSQISTWDTAGTVARVVERLRPLYRTALGRTPPAFVNLDMEEYRDLDLTVEVFTTLLSEPELQGLEAGIALQAYLPDSVAALEHLVDFARRRVEAGGAGIKVRLVKGANLSMEHVDAEVHGWAAAPYGSKAEVDANYVRLVERGLRPELAGVVRVGLASHNLYHVALAHLLAERRGVTAALDVEMLQGMAPAQARAVKASTGGVLLYTPVVAPQDFDVAVSYLVRRLEENAEPQNFLHALFAGDGEARSSAHDDQERRFRDSVATMASTPADRRRSSVRPPGGDEHFADAPDSDPALTEVPPASGTNRIANTPDSDPALTEVPPASGTNRFANTPDSDPALAEVRAWAGERVVAPAPERRAPVLASVGDVDEVVAAARRAHDTWGSLPGRDRAAVLRRAADELEARRGDLVTAMAREAGKTVGEADPEVSEAVDFARYYAARALELDPAAGHLATDGAEMVPIPVTLVTPPWNFPVAIPCGSVLASLAAGSAVVVKPAPQVPVCGEVAMGAIQAALAASGLPAEVLQVVHSDEGDVGRALVAHPDVGTVVLTGALDTARLFAGWRARHPGGPRVQAETSGKNALVVTPAADYDLAVADLVRSAFGHAGQKCSAASLVILVGSAGRSAKLQRQLLDAVRSLRVGWPASLGATMGPVIEPPAGKLLRALTTLEPGESWLVEPRPLDDSGRLWSPGLKDGVAPGSSFHLTECFGPVLGVMRADTLAEAIRLQNATAYGLTGGLHSLDEDEIATWLEHVEVGNAYVNRVTTGAIVQRQPFGGWKGSVVGPGAKAGGPNYVAQLGVWRPAGALPQRVEEPLPHVARARDDLDGLVRSTEDHAWLHAAAGSDATAWSAELGRQHDPTGLRAESNVLRYRPQPQVTVRAGADARPVELARLVLGAALTGTPLRLSLHPDVAGRLDDAATQAGDAARPGLARLHELLDRVETDDDFVTRVRSGAVTGRVRAVGAAGEALAGRLADRPVTVLTGPVLANGRRELLTFLREQAVSRTLHRFGHLPPTSTS
jgi:RHH-type transcriptional regulator, proline utilization regulon repressor / proline dehydrogenase / delta 1-pyrroline-5-carboxylate dehydrogenase